MRSGLGHLDEINRHIVEDHCRNPRNFEKLDSADAESYVENPICGDDVLIQIKFENDKLIELCVQGHGCGICQASASIMSEVIKGLGLSEASQAASVFRKMMVSGNELNLDEADAIGDAIALQDVKRFPIRVKCALLSWVALEEALEKVPD